MLLESYPLILTVMSVPHILAIHYKPSKILQPEEADTWYKSSLSASLGVMLLLKLLFVLQNYYLCNSCFCPDTKKFVLRCFEVFLLPQGFYFFSLMNNFHIFCIKKLSLAPKLIKTLRSPLGFASFFFSLSQPWFFLDFS